MPGEGALQLMEVGGMLLLQYLMLPLSRSVFFLEEPPSDVFCEAALCKLCGLLFGRCKDQCRRTWPLLTGLLIGP